MRQGLRIRKACAKSVAVLLSASLAFSSFPAVSLAVTSSDISAELQEVQERIVALSNEAEQCSYELQAATHQLNETNTAISDLSAAIEQTEVDLSTARDHLSTTMAWTYRSRPDIVSLILSSRSFDELISSVYYANKVSAAQTDAVGRILELTELQEQQMGELEQRKVEQEQLVAQQEERASAAQAAVDELSSYQASLSQELQEALAAEEAARQAEAQRRAQEEAALRAAEEAARQAEAQSQAQEEAASQSTGGAPTEPAATEPAASEESSSYDSGSSESYEESGETESWDDDSSSNSYEETIYVAPSGSVSAMVDRAYSVIGANYTWSGYVWTGNLSTSYFTCSGLVDFALGRSTNSSWPESLYAEVGSRMVYDISELNYGDLVFFTYAGRYPGHVGIYIGNGMMIDSCPGVGVSIGSMYTSSFIGGGPIY